ncbi:MAG: SDR family oxidoreductase [Syntrophorhabdales bacterium]
MAGRLSGKVAVVTGAGKGIGRATALALAREGADVVITSRTKSDLDSLAAQISALGTGARALVVAADVSKEEDVDHLAKAAFEEFGQVDILVNNAGLLRVGTISKLTTADYDWVMDNNMRSTWLCTKAFMPSMLKRKTGAVIFINSVAGLYGGRGESLYAATKFAQMGFAQAIDYEAYPNNVRVCVIAPGATNTNIGFDSGARTPGDPALQTFHETEDVANAVVFAVTQPPKTRAFLIGLRPMTESLGAGLDPAPLTVD